MQSLWKVRPQDLPRARALADAAGIDRITAQLLLNRGMRTAAEASRFTRPTLETLGNPAVLPDMARAVERIRRTIANQEPIVIFGDSDVDGLSASVILYDVLRGFGAAVRARQSNRIADGYGLPGSLVASLCRSSTKLVILVDCGTNQPDAVQALAAHGIDTVIVDHHVPLARWARPLALINPHREQGAGRELCSAGLALKLAQALFDGEVAEPVAAAFDLAALGTLADCSPLVGENRVIVSEGLARIVRSHRPGLRRLCEDTGTVKAEPEQVLRRLVPRLNASGRLGHPAAVWHLLREEHDERLEEWLALAEAAHATTKQLHRQIQSDAQEQINRLHFRDQYVMVVSRTGWHPGLMGPLASQLAERYGRPAIAIALDEHRGVGSGRSQEMFNLLKALSQCQNLLVAFGGHARACGLTIHRRHLEPFRALLNHHAREQIGCEGLIRTRVMDLELPLSAVQPRWVEETEQLAPFGQGNPRPTIVIHHVATETISPRLGWLSDGGVRVRAKGNLATLVAGTRYDVAVTPAVVEGTVVLTVNDAKPSTGPSGPVRT